MNCVSNDITEIIIDLQTIPTLKNFYLAGGTNLALRYQHRISEDIDLFCSNIIGFNGFYQIENDIKSFFGERARFFQYPCDINDQFCFLRFYVNTKNESTIKIEILQNMKHIQTIENIQSIKLCSKTDVGLFKLDCLSSRIAKKDIYDLDILTDEVSILELFSLYKEKRSTYYKLEDRNIFDLDLRPSAQMTFDSLLRFDQTNLSKQRPYHSNDRVRISASNKSWEEAKISWKSKVRQLYYNEGQEFPAPLGIDIE